MKHNISHELTKFTPNFIKQIPLIKIENGIVITPEKRSYNIVVEDELFMVIDTTGKFLSLKESKSRILITADTIHLNRKSNIGNKISSYDLSQVNSFTLTQDDLSNYVNVFDNFIVWFIAIFC